MATPKLSKIRYFYDASDRWRYFETGKVEICRRGTSEWVETSLHLSDLVGHRDMHEVPAEVGASWTA